MRQEEMLDLWDAFHPSDSDDELDEFSESGDYSDLEEVPQIPTIDRLPDVVDYSARGPGDFVVSGPTGAGRGAGRYFKSLHEAYSWAVGKYGSQRVVLIPQESEFRWALMIRAV
jgi:hypothetical protein